MADLIDRISGASLFETPERPKINLHRFMALERLYALGEWTRLQIASSLDLQGAEATQATQIADNIDAQSNISSKVIYIARVESVMMIVEDIEDRLYHNTDGTVNKSIVFQDLQITG